MIGNHADDDDDDDDKEEREGAGAGHPMIGNHVDPKTTAFTSTSMHLHSNKSRVPLKTRPDCPPDLL
ncbi:hypothetical protein NC651_031712 [Populus alba x Populus x berolinensis]|nr:hypothetical protein NC651_031712 [Populus alba x Populus x berolinensis]